MEGPNRRSPARMALLVIMSLFVPFGVAAMQGAGDVTIQAVQHPTYGRVLADQTGRLLYLFTDDSGNESTCYDECLQAWLPLRVSGQVKAGQGVARTLLGTLERRDGSLQATYNGWPLYYYAADRAPGEAGGQGAGGKWFLVSPYGVAVKPPEPREPASSAPAAAGEISEELMKQGMSVFAARCAVCHGSRGEGGPGPALVGNPRLEDGTFVARQIMLGSRFMPRFDNLLSDEEVMAVATFIRNAWGNSYGPVTLDQVTRYR